MFFEERIRSIRPGDRVLEIGPGATPHERSDVFLEKEFASKKEYIAQTGHLGELKTDKQVVYYNGDIFPFADQEFDYVICSHVLEHVEDPVTFLKEIQRVAKRGYLEFPTLYYDYLYNFPEHTLLLNYKDGVVRWMRKSDTPLDSWKAVQNFFYRTCELEYFSLINELKPYFFQGFEWEGNITAQQETSIEALCYHLSSLDIPSFRRTLATEAPSKGWKHRLKHHLIHWIHKW